jgi:hypothetical protein
MGYFWESPRKARISMSTQGDRAAIYRTRYDVYAQDLWQHAVTAAHSLSKMLSFTLATAVLIDATLVRMVIGPAPLRIGGDWNWWPWDLGSRPSC